MADKLEQVPIGWNRTRLSAFSRLICPSVWPLLHDSTAVWTACMSTISRGRIFMQTVAATTGKCASRTPDQAASRADETT
jgi:hypothetical protein